MAERKKDPQLLEIVECRDCHQQEYYGMMIWHNDHTYCRKCTYERWAKESGYKWWPGEKDYTFPQYSDGIIYNL